jgi:hypothetical protein
MPELKLPFRQVHLDFHTGPDVPQIGSEFDARVFAQAMVDARVNSVTLFAKCHHGHLYYETDHPARHPHLARGFDLLRLQVDALHERGIQAPIYLSVQCDEYAANAHPEWVCVAPDGKAVGPGPFQAGWQILDMSSPYQDFLADQIADVVRRFKPVDGIFLDMCWDQVSCSAWAKRGMARAGLDPQSDADRQRYAYDVVQQYMARYNRIIHDLNGSACKVWYNSRPKVNLPVERRFLQHVEIEALPTGGWGYTYFPVNIRFARTFGLPCLGMTGRFHKSWADFGGLKPQAALQYECVQMIAHGAACSIGDQLHPRGTLDAAAYQAIGAVYRHVEQCEPWCEGARPLTDVAVVRGGPMAYHLTPGDANSGAMWALQQLRHQFDFIHAEADLSRYQVIVVPDEVAMTDALRSALRSHLARGGGVLLSGDAAFPQGQPALAEQSVQAHGPSPYQAVYLRYEPGRVPETAPTDHVMYERGLRITAQAGAAVLATVVEPYFDRTWQHFCSHFQTPPDRVSPYAAAVCVDAGKGRLVSLAYPMFRAYGTHGNIAYRRLIAAAMNLLLPRPLVKFTGASHVEVTLTRQLHAGGRTIAHVVSFVPNKRTPTLEMVEEATPVVDAELLVKLEQAPVRVTLAPQGEVAPFTYRDGYASVRLSFTGGHQMVVFE